MSNAQEAQLETILVLIENQQQTIQEATERLQETSVKYESMLSASGEQTRKTSELAEEIRGTQREWHMTTSRVEALINVFPWKLATIMSLAIALSVGIASVGWIWHTRTKIEENRQFKALSIEMDKYLLTTLYETIGQPHRTALDAIYRNHGATPPGKRR